MKKSRTVIFIAVLLLLIPLPVFSDAGPKPSVVIEFSGLTGEKFYVTLLSENDSTGPHSALGKYRNNQRYFEGDKDYEIWLKFLSYEDEDGFYFLQYFQNCTETQRFEWTYYPPARFKILLYFPEYDSFAVSDEIYERYAFDSYFRIDAGDPDIKPGSTAKVIRAEKSYNYKWELVSLFARIIITIAVELVIAFLFGFRTRKQVLVIASVNIVTQSVLNILLNIITYRYGSFLFAVNYAMFEIVVFIIEAAAFSILLNRYSDNGKARPWAAVSYALAANAVSLVFGLLVAYLVPGVF